MLRSVLRFVLSFMLVIALWGWFCLPRAAQAGTPDRPGNNAEVYSITISPGAVTTNSYPEIKGFVRNTSLSSNDAGGKAAFDVVVEITNAQGVQKSMVWRDVRFAADQRKSYTTAHSYDIGQPGNYKVVYSVYNVGRTHLYATLSKTFTVTAPAAGKKTEPPARPEKTRQPAKAETKKPEKLKKAEVIEQPSRSIDAERKYLGIGGYVNTLNFSGGGTLVFWPLKDLAVQGTYGVGTFTSYEGRVFYRLPLSSGWKPYFGAGYLHAARDTNVIGLKTTVAGSSVTAFGGVELPLTRSLYGYVDISGTSLKLKKDVANGIQAATVKVDYAPVTINVGVVFYLF